MLAAAFLLAACETMPRDAFRLSESALATRDLQTRQFHAASDAVVLSASMAVLQDMGYVIDEIEQRLGVLSASKRADATNKLEAFGSLSMDAMQCLVTFMLGCTGRHYGEIDDVQDIRLTVITRQPNAGGEEISVRITIQRIIWDKDGRMSAQETVTDSQVYEDFFAKLSKAVFLEQENV